MTRRPFGLTALTLLVLALAALGAAGLGWVTVSALRVEDDQRMAAAAAERAEKERLALWKLDGRVAPALGLEAFRKYEDFTVLYSPPNESNDGPQYLSPLISADLPEWIPLHFQFDATTGWTSPQVLAETVVGRLANPANNLDLTNLTVDRRDRLATLNRRFPVSLTVQSFKPLDADTSDSSAVVVAVVPKRSTEGPSPQMELVPPGLTPPKSQAAGANLRGAQSLPPAFAGNSSLNQLAQQGGARNQAEKNAVDESYNRGRFGEKVMRDVIGGIGNSQWVNPVEHAPDFVGPPTPEWLKKPSDVQSPGLPPSVLVPSPAPAPMSMAVPAPPPGPVGGFGSGPGGPGGKGGTTGAAGFGGGLPGGGAGGPPPMMRGAPRPLAPAPPGGSAKKKEDSKADESKAKNDASKDKAEAFATRRANTDPKGGEPPSDKKEAEAPGDTPPRKQDDTPLAVKKPAPPVPPVAVHLGAMRPLWLADLEGKRELMVVRPARLEGKTVYQGALLDWDTLRTVMKEEVADDFPTADLVPVDGPTDAPRHQLSTLPVRFDAGPLPAPPPAGWTPLRLGLALAWLAAAVALVAVWFGGWSLIDLSERRIRFVSAVTHELRTPLTSLRLYLDMLTSGMVTDETQKAQYLTTLSHESNRLNQLIENVLDFAKLENRAGAVQKQLVPIAELIDHCRETWAERLAADGKEFVAVSTVPAGQTVTADPRIAQQILGNLIDNARKYSPDAADPRVWLWVKPAGKRVAFEVEDRGPGIPAAERASIFRPFRRGGTSGATGGAGLGLALAKQWAESLGGKLICRPADGGAGACFRLELPA